MELHPGRPYELVKECKDRYLLTEFNSLTRHHYEYCPQYRKIIDRLWRGCTNFQTIEEIPYLPVRLFKHATLRSIPQKDVVKTMTSSGTTGQEVSRIYLDKETSSLQTKILSKIVSELIGPHRLPMLVIDSQSAASNRQKFSARTAGILGFSMYGRPVEYALNDDMELDLTRVGSFLKKYASERILVFGFTFVIWQHFVKKLEEIGVVLSIKEGILIHGGGWKKLETESVQDREFKQRLKNVAGIEKIHNYYGMVEQTGSIFMECEEGYLHASIFSDILIRDPMTFEVLEASSSGLIQLLSVIPHSYPGHSLLSEDIGELVGADDCACGRLGKYFKVHGRLKSAEIRGCSDTYSR